MPPKTPTRREPLMQTELSPTEKLEVYARFEDALLAWLSEVNTDTWTIHDVFYAGYRAGYGHAKDDAQAAMEKQR